MRIALAGNPNSGKTALFNALTGGRQKVGNYPGVTVERKEGRLTTPHGIELNILDLPGAYSLDARTPDEAITRDILLGKSPKEKKPHLLIAVADATNLERSLGLVLELQELDKPIVLALNMMDLARRRGLDLDLKTLSQELKAPVIPTVAVKKEGIQELIEQLESHFQHSRLEILKTDSEVEWNKPTSHQIRARFKEVDRILKVSVRKTIGPSLWSHRIDRVMLHPVFGIILLMLILGFMFQALFSWAKYPQEWIQSGLGWLSNLIGLILGDGPLSSLLIHSVIAGVGSVLVFLPQIILLFLFILMLEDSGYMARAAFLMDRLMGSVGLHGRAFIPLLSSFACAIPGIMATRTIENRRDRLTTILVSPLMTCSARLPVYSLLIAAFIPNLVIWGPIRLQGLIMFFLYFSGVFMALLMAMVFKKFLLKGPKPPLLLELPTYKWPSGRNILLGLLERARLFVRRAGTVILSLSILLWFLASYPKAMPHETQPPIYYSYAGKIGHALEPLLSPLGFNWKIAIALIPGFAAREVMVGALATVFSVERAQAEDSQETLIQALAQNWSIATGLSLLVWYILACQCFSTLAVTRRETNSLRWPMVMLVYMTVLAYTGSFFTYQFALWMGLGT